MSLLILGLGGNKGDVLITFSLAEKLIESEIGSIRKSSSIYQTAAWGNINQPDFLNKVIVVESELKVEKCLELVLNIENKLGRTRTNGKWGERKIDIDILFYDNFVIETPELVVPHSYIQERNFVLFPLVEIVPNFIHPIFKKTTTELLNTCTDKSSIKKILKSE